MVARKLTKRFRRVKLAALALAAAGNLAAQDPSELPPSSRAAAPPSPPNPVSRSSVDEKALAATIDALVACGTRHALSSWDDPKRGIGCARDRILERYRTI